MHLHILGICGTFMGGLAALAREAGHRVTGCDAGVYPPMSEQLRALGIDLIEGFGADQLALRPDVWVVGNVVSRGNPLMEAILDARLPYRSGPQWLAEQVLVDRWVMAVAGTHGKTTTTAMLAWILEACGRSPGFLIGGVPVDFAFSARLSQPDTPFVIEADEYDTAFFDKRSKFVHYRPTTAVLNNLEFDHADIFPDLAAIETQFHHLIRTIPGSGQVIAPGADAAIDRVLSRGLWSGLARFDHASAWQAGPAHEVLAHDAAPLGWSEFEVRYREQAVAVCRLPLTGAHNRSNALAAIAAAVHGGVAPVDAVHALSRFGGVRRRMEVRGQAAGVTVIDDFAHHPTAMATTLAGLRARLPAGARILAVFEPRSNTMKLGAMKARLPGALIDADLSFCFSGGLGWDACEALAPLGAQAQVLSTHEALVDAVVRASRPGDRVLVMSNGGFGGIHQRLLQALEVGARARNSPAEP